MAVATCPHCQERIEIDAEPGRYACPLCGKAFTISDSANVSEVRRQRPSHGPNCRYYEATAQGRHCQADEGTPCGICGGKAEDLSLASNGANPRSPSHARTPD